MNIKQILTENIDQLFPFFYLNDKNLDQKKCIKNAVSMLKDGYVFFQFIFKNIPQILVVAKINPHINGNVLTIYEVIFSNDLKKIDKKSEKFFIKWINDFMKLNDCNSLILLTKTNNKELQRVLSSNKFILDGFVFSNLK